MHQRFSWSRTVHDLEYLLLALSERIRSETGNDDLADAARRLASASHNYDPSHEPEPLAEMCEDWRRRFGTRTEEILKRLEENPEYKENARRYREILDASEAKDSEALRAFVDERRKKV